MRIMYCTPAPTGAERKTKKPLHFFLLCASSNNHCSSNLAKTRKAAMREKGKKRRQDARIGEQQYLLPSWSWRRMMASSSSLLKLPRLMSGRR